jgi:aspartyl-tRNA(Asn)/glutamyl-tRNA(Gln) amidotransferase subunit C
MRSGTTAPNRRVTAAVPPAIRARQTHPQPEATMQVDEATVRRIARLARVRITPDEVKGLEKELSGILNWVEQLNEVDVDGVAPMTRVVDVKLKMRDDVVTDGGIADDVTRNAPMSDDHFYVVPKVVE